MSPGDRVVMTWQWKERQGKQSDRCHVFTITTIDPWDDATLERRGVAFLCHVNELQAATDDDIAHDEGKP